MRTTLILLFVTLSFSAFANQTKYILFEPNCMDRLEYQHNTGNTNYITYQVHTSSGIIALEVGVENTKDYTIIPKGAIGCGNAIFDEKLVKSINSNLIDVYIIMPTEYGHYRISPSRMASYMSKDMQAGKIIRTGYELNFSDSNENLATSSSQYQVFYEGEGSKCEAYRFRTVSKDICRPETEIFYLKGIGIIKEKVAGNLDKNSTASVDDSHYSLTKINGVSLQTFKDSHCKGNRIQLGMATAPLVYAPTSKPVEQKAFVPKKCTNFEEENHHLVQYGENLYSIARQEGLTIKQLRKWNNLKTTKIMACSQLKIQPPTPKYVAAKAKPKKKFNVKGIAKKAKKNKKYVAKHKAVKSSNGVHIVQKGENLYLLAKLYGYTTGRMAHMNGINENAILTPGTKLFTTDCNCPSDGEQTHDSVEIPVETELPVLSGGTEEVPAERIVAAPKVTYHLVQEGETVWSIANYYGFDTTKLMERNNLEAGEVLIPGQKIYLPR